LLEGERRLAAIMFTDMVGYTALSQRNEALAMQLLQEHRKILRPLFARNHGREVKTVGDAFLVEFPSALEAVRCAFDVQQSLHEFNSDRSVEKKLLIRVGVHVGDVINSQADVYGDAVNVASRLEPLAEPGGICVSQQVFDHVRNKTDFELARVAEVSLKNVELPLAVYKVVLPWRRDSKDEIQPTRDRVAVLPFVNISPDPADEYFADGMTEELIDRLSQMKELKVIARTSVMSYKKKEKGVSDIARELKVGTVVEGSIRKAGNKIRVTVQLINAGSEEHLWSERYDKDLDDIFAVQTEIASKVATSLAGALAVEKAPKVTKRDTENIAAYSRYLQGLQLLHEGTGRSIRRALPLLEEAVKLDPNFARAHAALGECYLESIGEAILSDEEAREKAIASVKAALEIDPDLAEAHAAMAYVGWSIDDHPMAMEEIRRAIELNPNLAGAYSIYGTLQATNGYPEQAMRLLEKALSLDPLGHWAISHLGLLYAWRGRKQEAEDHWARNLAIAPYDVLYDVGFIQLNERSYEKAEEQIRSLESEFPSQMGTVAIRGYLEALKGNRAGAEETIKALYSKFGARGLTNHHVGMIKCLLGDMDGFFDAMLRTVQDHNLNPWIRYWPLLEKARQDPRYREVMLKSGLDPVTRE
jgi:adenylate cyclase